MTFAGAVLGVFAGALLASIVGWAASRFFTAGLGRSEKIAWSFATGLLVQAILFLIIVSILSRPPLLPLLLLDAVLVATSLLARRARFAPRWGQARILVFSFLAVAALAWLVFFVSAMSEPMWATDYVAMWGLKGKTIHEMGSVPRRLFEDPGLFWARRDYPLLVPLSLATFASFSGGWNDQALALLFPLCELATLAAVYGFLARRVSQLAGAVAASLTALCFPLYAAVNVGVAEIPLALGLVLVSCGFLDALEGGSPATATNARLFMASLFSASTKPEGTLFVLLVAAVWGIRQIRHPVRMWKGGGWALLVPPVLHGGLLRLLGRPPAPRDFDPTFFEPGRWSELLSRLGVVLARILGVEVLRAWIPLLAIVLFFLLTRRSMADPLLAVFALQIVGYAAAFSISSFDPMWAVDAAFRRIVTTLFPAFTLVLGARVAIEEPGRSAAAGVPCTVREAAPQR